MGKNSRNRKARSTATAFEPAADASAPDPKQEVVRQVSNSLLALADGDDRRFDDHVVVLAARCGDADDRPVIVRAVRDLVDTQLRHAWEKGWQPADIHRLALRRSTKSAAAFVVHAIRHELRTYARDTVPAGWRAQLDDITDTPVSHHDPITASRDLGLGWLDVLDAALRALHLLTWLPAIESIGPAPGQWVAPQNAEDHEVEERILTRVRMLLAKAESTPYEAEAETFTAGAASLIARHRISEAMLAASRSDRTEDGIQARRIGIDNPYEEPKAHLLSIVAEANSCRVVWVKPLGYCTVVGFVSDLAAVELLFTSLLLQATNTMTGAGRRSTEGAHRRSRAFRSSFLTSFAVRIGERLREAAQTEERSAARDSGCSGERLPVLVEREQDVADATDRLFPQVVRTRSRRTHDLQGWQHGRRAADAAEMRSRGKLSG